MSIMKVIITIRFKSDSAFLFAFDFFVEGFMVLILGLHKK
jgi:hypothetical protein